MVVYCTASQHLTFLSRHTGKRVGFFPSLVFQKRAWETIGLWLIFYEKCWWEARRNPQKQKCWMFLPTAWSKVAIWTPEQVVNILKCLWEALHVQNRRIRDNIWGSCGRDRAAGEDPMGSCCTTEPASLLVSSGIGILTLELYIHVQKEKFTH